SAWVEKSLQVSRVVERGSPKSDLWNPRTFRSRRMSTFSSQINCVLLQFNALIPAGGAEIFLSSLTSKLHAVDLCRIC
ncbi:hypothetical protein, partial [Aerosakkonema funiforme]|uniref:hypothetical protein n=1 Tax=Aerosakkonema funiforme TaxID=1246630 RepID=UPI001A7E6626